MSSRPQHPELSDAQNTRLRQAHQHHPIRGTRHQFFERKPNLRLSILVYLLALVLFMGAGLIIIGYIDVDKSISGFLIIPGLACVSGAYDLGERIWISIEDNRLLFPALGGHLVLDMRDINSVLVVECTGDANGGIYILLVSKSRQCITCLNCSLVGMMPRMISEVSTALQQRYPPEMADIDPEPIGETIAKGKRVVGGYNLVLPRNA
jgi:hypothetical protein